MAELPEGGRGRGHVDGGAKGVRLSRGGRHRDTEATSVGLGRLGPGEASRGGYRERRLEP